MVSKLDYAVRESHRAKRVILKVSPKKGLEVVIPRGFNRRHIGRIINDSREWIDRHLAAIESAPGITRPDRIDLAALGERWEVQYRPTHDTGISISQAQDAQLYVEGDVGDIEFVAQVLSRWLHRKAQVRLIPWLRAVSEESGIPFKKATVRGQTTRWASCSQNHNISLNRSLLFLPGHLVRHVFLHELCHIEQPDHSARFWGLLESIEPGYRGLETEVKNANHHVPQWANGNHRQ
ncbi:MAG: DUF45 domain-containing protein [Chloroflexi bacterium]|nr:DUF45 domain-containing protein [Chloroflexota bacterium]MDA1269792.1 DUF45 domain-containing protein [Chloroflexota bacterium]